MRIMYSFVAAALLAGNSACAAQSVTAAEFAAKALAALPVEERYAFAKRLSEWQEPVRRDPAARPSADEMAVPAQGWRLLVRADAGPVLKQAAEDFREYLEGAMQVRVAMEAPASLDDWSGAQRAILAGAREQLPGCGAGLTGAKDYRIVAGPERIVVCGYDERGAMYGLYNLEARMNLREAPFLPARLDTTRRSLYRARMTLTGLGYMEWPDAYLRLLAHYGFDSIFASDYANPNGVQRYSHQSNKRKGDPAAVHDLIRRAAKYGLELYCPVVWLYTGEAESEAGLRKLVRDLATEFPEVRGWVLLQEGFTIGPSPGAQGGVAAWKDWIRRWDEAVRIAAEEFHKVNPKLDVLPWAYNISSRPEPASIELRREVIRQLPRDVIPLLTWDRGMGFERDGQRGYSKDYSINEAGPAECTLAEIEEAQRRGLPVYAKADTAASWQFGTFPYLPFPYQWYERYRALEKYRIQGTMESWTYGFKPNWVAELRTWFSWSEAPPLEDLLRAMARRNFGAGSEEPALAAWRRFSNAIRLIPDTGPYMGTNNAVAAPMFFEKPRQPRAMTLEHSWQDQQKWSAIYPGLNPYWPYVLSRVILWPDFTNAVNAAERYTQPFSVGVFTKYLTRAADEMEAGLHSYRQAALQTPPSKRADAFREVLLAEHLQRMMRSDRAVLEFEDLRFRLAHTSDQPEQARLLDRMTEILKEEAVRVRESKETVLRDSRLGYQWEQDYFYTPFVLDKKLELIRDALERQIPAYRRRMAAAQPPAPPAPPRITGSGFAAKALAALPVEEPYDFLKPLYAGTEPLRRNPAARPAPGEMAIPAQGWSLVVPSRAGVALKQAAETFRKYLAAGMGTRVTIETRDSLADWKTMTRAIVAAARAELPGCGAAMQGRKDYQLLVSPERVVVCGYDERGALYGLYNLEARMNLREAPFLPRDLNTVRHSLYQARMTLTGLGWEEWPDAYLSLLSRYGFDSIYACVYANPNGALTQPPYDTMRRQDPTRMRDLVRRAARYGLDVYCPIMYGLTGDAANEAGLRKLIRDTVAEFPEIRGYVLLIEGFNYTGWPPGWSRDPEGLRNWIRGWVRGVRVATEEFHRLNPNIEVLPWDYNIDFRPEAVEVKKFVIDEYPPGVIPLLTFENGKSFERDGERGYLKDYAINEAGPAEVTAAQIARARERGLPTIYAKADTWATWQFGTFPYLPFPYQWYTRYQALEQAGIAGTMESWSYGFKPNWVAEMRAWYSWSDAPPLDALLRAIARREFGAGNEKLALEAWDHFSRAIRLVPDTGPNMGTTNAIGAPFFFEKGEPLAMTQEHSWTDPERWMQQTEISPYWPFAPRRVILLPDFSNRVNAAERYARPFSLKVFNKYLLLAADEMAKGLQSYRRAALAAPEAKRRTAFREVLLAEQLQRMMRSDQAILEFEDLRFKLSKTADQAGQRRMLDRMTGILKEEIARTRASLEASRRDSRLGYEYENDYFYTPYVLEEKLRQLKHALEVQLPAHRKQSGMVSGAGNRKAA